MATTMESSQASTSGDLVETPQEAKERVMRQVEFYLSDSNLPYDRFLWNLHDKSSDHWIPLRTISSFKRMREFEKYGHSWLVEALRESTKIEVDEKGDNIRRKGPLVERPRESVEEKSVYAKGFPDEYPNLQVELERYFSRFGAISAVRMRRQDNNKAFKNSVFCEYSEVEGALRFLGKEESGTSAAGEKPKREFKGSELVVMSKADYIKMKCEEKGIQPDTPNPSKGAARDSKSKFNAFRLMKKEGRTDSDPRPTPQKVEKTYSILGQDLTISQDPSESAGGWKLVDDDSLQYVPGAMVRFEAKDGEVKMGAIKGTIRDSLSIPCYVINPPGTNTGYVAFQKSLSPDEYEKFVSSAGSIQGVTYSWQKLSEDEEKPLQKDYVLQSIQRLADDTSSKGGKSGRGGGGRGGRSGGKGGSRNRERAEKESQSTKTGKENGASGAGMEVDPLSGAKRKREGEPDGPEKGERGSGPAVIKKIRVE